ASHARRAPNLQPCRPQTCRRVRITRRAQGFRVGHDTRPFPKRSPFAGTEDQVRPQSGMSASTTLSVDWPTCPPYEPHQATALRRSRTEASSQRADDAKGIDLSRPVTEARIERGEIRELFSSR